MYDDVIIIALTHACCTIGILVCSIIVVVVYCCVLVDLSYCYNRTPKHYMVTELDYDGSIKLTTSRVV